LRSSISEWAASLLFAIFSSSTSILVEIDSRFYEKPYYLVPDGDEAELREPKGYSEGIIAEPRRRLLSLPAN
jgi:hypothetical protein